MSELNIYQKLLEVRKRVEYVKKNANGFKFVYADETSILSAIRPSLDQFGLLLEFEMEKPEIVLNNLIQVGFVFTWINTDNISEKIEKRIYLQTTAGDPQKIGGLMTYANRYFLYKYFNVPTDSLDIDDYSNQFTKITPENLAEITKLLGDDSVKKDKLLKWAKIKNLEDLSPGKFREIMPSLLRQKEEGNA